MKAIRRSTAKCIAVLLHTQVQELTGYWLAKKIGATQPTAQKAITALTAAGFFSGAASMICEDYLRDCHVFTVDDLCVAQAFPAGTERSYYFQRALSHWTETYRANALLTEQAALLNKVLANEIVIWIKSQQ